MWKTKALLFTLIFTLPTLVAAFTPLPADKAFRFSVQREKHKLIASWKIARGYHLFKDSFQFQTSDGSMDFDDIHLPKGIMVKNASGKSREIYRNTITLPLSLSPLKDPTDLFITYQGCAEAGFCYPIVTQRIKIDSISDPWLYTSGGSPPTQTFPHNPFLFLGSFFLLGLLLSFTPCVYPMFPILLGIIAGQDRLSALRAFWLSSTYVLGSASAYAIAGVFAGSAGSYLQAVFQQPWIIVLTSLVFIFFAFSLFGWFELSLPSRWQKSLAALNRRQPRGTFIGVALMGALSTLVVSPCITAPLVGVLAYISQTGNATAGGSALFMMGIGMGTPLILLGTFGGNILPKAGAWMTKIKSVFGIIFLVMAAWMLLRIFPISGFGVTDPFKVVQGLPAVMQAIEKAKMNHQPVLLDVYAKWCHSCNEMMRNTFPHPKVQAALRNTVLLRTDITQYNAENKALLKHFNLIGAPAILFFNTRGKEIPSARIIGEINAQGLLDHLHKLQEQSLWPSPPPT